MGDLCRTPVHRRHGRASRLLLLLLFVTSTALAQDVPANTSVGGTHSGSLSAGGFELPRRGEGFHFVTNRGNPDARYGTPSLVRALMGAAAEVRSDHPGSDLAIHDVSLYHGGPIRGHGSHRSGRDVDIAYYALEPGGAPMNPTASVWFMPSGRERNASAARARRFDAARIWRFVRALLGDDTIRVQYIFMQPGLQRLLLAEAGHDGLARRARRVLRRPRGRRVDPHADHMHVRIHCPPRDVRHGCTDGRRR